ncbi:MAG: cell division protein ZipA C-terminal FtsZ-binding domain-containing protein [Gammaproteobacteria bacterium]
MGAELRWILLGVSVPLLALIWWWTARRSGQAPGNAELRESTAGKAPEAAPPLDPRYADADDEEEMMPHPEQRDWGVPPFEPLHIRTAEFDRVPVLDGPMMVDLDAQLRTPASPSAAAEPPLLAAPGAGLGDNSDRYDAAPPPAPYAAELQRIVTIRVCSVGETLWTGVQLMAALELHGLAFGRYQVFHRKHADGRSLFCVASLIEPGTFDIAAMAEQEFRGVTLFAVMPGPIPPTQTVDELIGTARALAEELSGVVQDAKGLSLSPQRAAALREDVVRFQASLAGH